MTQGNTRSDGVWSVRGVDENLRDAVRRESARTGKNLGEVLSEIIGNHYVDRKDDHLPPAADTNPPQELWGREFAAAEAPQIDDPLNPVSHGRPPIQSETGEPSGIEQIVSFTDDRETATVIPFHDASPRPFPADPHVNSKKPTLSLPEPGDPFSDNEAPKSLFRPDGSKMSIGENTVTGEFAEDEAERPDIDGEQEPDRPAQKTVDPGRSEAEVKPEVSKWTKKWLVIGATMTILTVAAQLFGETGQAGSRQPADVRIPRPEQAAGSGQAAPKTLAASIAGPGTTVPGKTVGDISQNSADLGEQPSEEELIADLTGRAEQGDANAAFRLALMLIRTGPGDLDRVKALLVQAAESGYGPAQLALGILLNSGKVFQKDKRKAAVWLVRAADSGELQAYYLLGMHYALGLGVERDLIAAYKLLHIAHKNGHTGAARALDRILSVIPPNRLSEISHLL